MQKRHIHTTLSLKHAQLLDKFGEKFGNKQKAIEFALENLENSSRQTPKLSSEQQLLLRMFEDNSFRTIFSGGFLWLLATADFELAKKLVDKEKPMEYTLEFVYQKPLNDCSLLEVLDGLVLVSRMSKWYDTFNYSDEGVHYLLRAYHSMGINGSIMSQMFGDSLFNTYGVKFESTISEKTVFYKIYKNGQEKQTN
jgi:hypothetical protein